MGSAIMHAPAEVREIFRVADYRVRLPGGESASIHIHKPLPVPLVALLPGPRAAWGFITAWNPGAASRSRQENRAAQRDLRDALLGIVDIQAIHPGVGSAPGWREPSLFVAGIACRDLDLLMLRFDQLAVVRGDGAGRAALRWHDEAARDHSGL
jgi:hypothetical protein